MKPILFNTDMVRAILEGRKTVTRRVVKPQPEKSAHSPYECCGGRFAFCIGDRGCTDQYRPPYRPGDILYVRETWAPFYETMYSAPVIGYRYYSETDEEIKERLPEYLNWFWPGRWYPSIHMPREAARIFLRVTDVRVERLQDITEDGSMAEGIQCRKSSWARIEFADLWNSTIKPDDILRYGWEANPWVWVIEFERISREEAQR